MIPTTMSLGIAEFPQDVLMEVAKLLDVGDLLSFLSTCHAIRELQFEKSVWLGTLNWIKKVESRPLPLSTAESPETLSVSELQNIARQSHRLRSNLQSDKPRIFHTRSLSVTPCLSFFCIPGTRLVVTHARGSVGCWDILTARRVAYLEMDGLQLHQEALNTEINGKALIGACIRGLRDDLISNLVVICIAFQDRNQISISHVVSPATEDTYAYPSGFFIDPLAMGFIAHPRVVSWSMDAAEPIQCTPQQVTNLFETVKAGSLSLGQNIYLLGKKFCGAVQVIPHPAYKRQCTPIDSSRISNANAMPYRSDERPRLFTPHYGIFAVTWRYFTSARSDSWIHFRPAHVIDGHLEFDQEYVYDHPHPISRITTGVSGTYVLLQARPTGEESYLGLVHFCATPIPHTSFRKLDIDQALVSSCAEFALDDALGLVLLMDAERKVTVLSYM
ncbi:hypothetical protein K438DRAFT_1936035, partial [Mycena galopus ATCC 62051]